MSDKAVVRIAFSSHQRSLRSVLVKWPNHTLLYTGDVCMIEQELLPGMQPLDEGVNIDTLIIESTRGATEDEKTNSYGKEIRRFSKAIAEVIIGTPASKMRSLRIASAAWLPPSATSNPVALSK